MLKTKLRFLEKAIYKLKRSYGMPVALHKIDQHEIDTSTGVKTTTLGVIYINKAIVLRAREFRSFVYDLAYISANKDFTTGGYFDPEDRRCIIDAGDLNGYVPTTDDYIIFQNQRYDISEKYTFENGAAYGFLLKKIRGADVVSIKRTYSVLNIQQSVSYVIESRLNRHVTSVLNLTQDLKEVP